MTGVAAGVICAVIDGASIVRNKVIADPNKDAMEGYTLIASEAAQIGDRWDGATFTSPPAPPLRAAAPRPREWLERLSADKQAAVTRAGMDNASIMLWLFKPWAALAST
jgi:hypothetical protein